MIASSAPGKLVLSGEYAVLDGAPAVAMAVNRRARVSIEEGAAEPCVQTLGQSGDTRIVDEVCGALGVACDSCSIVLDTSEFCDPVSGAKLGLGSSAALSAALVSALAEQYRIHGKLRQAAHDAHRALQNGVGSGVDVACALDGGLLRFTMHGTRAERLAWPEGLYYAVLWSGVPASTADGITEFLRSKPRLARQALYDASQRMAEAWAQTDANEILVEYQCYVTALRQFDDELGLAVFAAGHSNLSDAAKEQGLVYKPCGAGGGDVGIVLGNDEHRVREFVTAVSFVELDVALDAAGVSFSGESA